MKNLLLVVMILGIGACASEGGFEPELESTEQNLYWVCCGDSYICANPSGCSYNQCDGIVMGDWCWGEETWHQVGEFEALGEAQQVGEWIPHCSGMLDICADW